MHVALKGALLWVFSIYGKKASEINIIVALIMVHCDEKWPEGKLSCVQLLSSRTGVFSSTLHVWHEPSYGCWPQTPLPLTQSSFKCNFSKYDYLNIDMHTILGLHYMANLNFVYF